MLPERGFFLSDRASKSIRAALTAALLCVPIAHFETTIPFPLKPNKAEASELDKNFEQAPVGDVEADVVKLIKAAHNLDIKTFSSFFPAPGESSFEVEWGFIHNSKKISLKELQTRLEYVLSDPPPQCLGVKRQGRVFLYPSVYFKNFGYLHELKQPQASGISRVRFLSNHMENRNTIIIEEIPKSEIEQELSGLEPCTGLTTGVRGVMDEPELSPDVLDLGTSVAKERIVFEAPAEEGGITLFISNLDGTNRKQLLPAKEGEFKRSASFVGENIVYEAQSSQGF